MVRVRRLRYPHAQIETAHSPLTIAAALYYSGRALYARLVARNRVVVLTYHRVLPSESAAASFSTPAIVGHA